MISEPLSSLIRHLRIEIVLRMMSAATGQSSSKLNWLSFCSVINERH